MRVLWVPTSQNKKLGRIPVALTPKHSCPGSCPLKQNGCYAGSGALNVHWKRLSDGLTGMEWSEFCATVAALPVNQLWRYGEAGDLPGQNENVDADLLNALVRANAGRRGFTFTHKSPVQNGDQIAANAAGFTVNLSANGVGEVDALADLGVGPVVTILPQDAPEQQRTAAGRRVVVCPAQSRKGVTCKKCALCADPRRQVVIGFRAHGSGRANGGKKVGELARANQ